MTNHTTPQVNPERRERVARSLKFYSIAAVATGIWLLVLVLEMVLKYFVYGAGNEPSWFLYLTQAHGLFFMIYVLTCLDLGTKARWEPSKWITTILAGVVPFLSFYVENRRRHEVKRAFDLN